MIAQAVTGVSELYLYGHIEYSDIFKEHHSTTFCVNWISGLSAACDRHNEVDPEK
jgi:hypothetical protein